MNTIFNAVTTPIQAQTRVDVFQEIFLVFLGLGTLVGVIVVAYTLYNAYKYRDTGSASDEDVPTLGELPTGGKGGKKLFLSFGLSAIIVISLVIWTYGMLLYVEDGPGEGPGEDAVEIDVTGEGFAWFFEYENGAESISTMNVPANTPIWITTTGGDVWHTFGIPELKVKSDAIPGEEDQTWFMADEPGETYEIKCFELCGDGHTQMTGQVNVMEEEEFDQWLEEEVSEDDEDGDEENGGENGGDEDGDEENGNETETGNETTNDDADNESGGEN
ncbi:cytochrome c oxidase subunit II [Halosolutus amylolyticus]|uniref:Cytochrome c oxidase subunit II n=1 Tax=Halosolutus amylolyticus TaxID=2932267 RepID=A0ABD5PPB8_9EURY|nr:cytochrome c oxidase subunit II [Halosolutus amylolyticus]